MFRSPRMIAIAIILTLFASAIPMTTIGSDIDTDLPLSLDLDSYTVLGRDDIFSVLGGEMDVPFGTSIASGDLDGDGRDDIAIGAPQSDLGVGGGAVMVFFAREPDELYTSVGHYDADLVITAGDEDDWFGYALLARDLNDDGRDELLIGAPFADGPLDTRRDSGEVYVIAGRQRIAFGTSMEIDRVSLFAHVYGRDVGDRLGIAIEAGDLNEDGSVDLIIRSEGNGGIREPGVSEFTNECHGSWEIEVIEGNNAGIGTVDLSLTPPMVRYFGEAVSNVDVYASHIGNGLAVGDFDGDGTEDLSFSYRYRGRGYAVVLLGSLTYPGVPAGTDIQVHEGADFDPDVQIDLYPGGWEEASLSYSNLDGKEGEDLVIGMPYATGYEVWRKKVGQADIFFGRAIPTDITLTRSDANITTFGVDSSDNWGKLTMGADMDSDGFDELIITAPGGDGVDNLEPNCGEAYMFDLDGTVPDTLTFQDSVRAFKGRTQDGGAFASMAKSEMVIDGMEEIIISSPFEEVDLGPSRGRGLVSIISLKSSFDASFVGQFNASKFGSVMVVADFDQDGNDDLVVGDPLGGGPERVGYVHLFFGESEGWSGRYFAAGDGDIYYNNAVETSEFGRSMTTGDLNNDGYPDFAVGAPLNQIDGLYNDAGSVSVYWGGPKTYMASAPNLTYEGYSVERVGSAIAVGDLNGDDIDDLVFSAPYDTGLETANRYHAGMVYIMFGPLSGSIIKSQNNYDVKIIGTEDNEFIGESLAISDIDDDGIDDLVIGAPKSKAGSITRQGVAYILRGRSTWNSNIDLTTEPSLRIFGPWPYDEVGSTMAAEDVDNDGKADLFIGGPNGDGFQRSKKEGGNLYILEGSFLASKLPSGSISLRNEYNVSICGDQEGQRAGSSIDIGDVDGDGALDLLIGARGYRDVASNSVTGGVFVFPNSLFSSSLLINTTSLPQISGFMLNDEAGYSIAGGDVNRDGRYDLFIGAPGADPMGDGNSPGAVYYWEGKDLFFLPIRAMPLEISGGAAIAGPLQRSQDVLAPGEGPYMFKVNARSLGGYQDMERITVHLRSEGAAGSAELAFDTQSETFRLTATGDFENEITLDQISSSARTDSVQSWFVEFAVDIGWDLPDPSLIVTSADGSSGGHFNYLNNEFVVDREVALDLSEMKVMNSMGSPAKGWLKADSEITVSNVSLVHGLTGITFGANASKIAVKLLRPDGIPIGSSTMNGSFLDPITTVPGSGIWGSDLSFRLSNGTLPRGAVWNGDQTLRLSVDTLPPPPVSSFNIFPDGQESGISNIDDDQVIEVFWTEVLDHGGSGISNYTLRILDPQMEIVSEMDYLLPGDLLFLPGGSYTFSFFAYDKAGNMGPMENRTMLLDVDGPRFTEAHPGDGSWITEETNRFSIKVKDAGAGIDLSSAMYRVYRADVKMLSDWMPVRSSTTMGDAIVLNTTAPVGNGFGHYIQWKVSDLAGQMSISLPYSFNMDTGIPTIDVGNQDGMMIGPGSFSIGCYMEDTGSGLLLDSIRYKLGSRDELYSMPWVDLGLSGAGASASPSIEVLPSYIGWGFAQWTVSDVAGNTVESDLISIFIDDELPVFTSFSPDGSGILQKRDVTVTAFIREEGSGIEISDVEYSLSTISGWVQYGVGGYSPWTRVDGLEDRGSGLFAGEVDVKLDEGPFNLIRFRVRDRAGNGFVVSIPLALEVAVADMDLPPTAEFAIYPATEVITQGDTIILDGSPSMDPEGKNLTFSWYSDLEKYPASENIGAGMILNVSLERPGVHRIWLIVSDGKNTVESERYLLTVEQEEGDDDGEGSDKGDMWDWFEEWLPLLIIALLVGILLGGISVYFLISRRELEAPPEPGQPLVDARYEPEIFVPVCPYCGSEARLSDEYCMKCGTVFSSKDKADMEKAMKKGRKKKTKELLPQFEDEEDIYEDSDELDWDEEEEDEEEEDEEDEDEDEDEEEEEDEDEEDLDDELIPTEEEIEVIDEEEADLYDDDEIEDMELEDLDLEEEEGDEWGVGP
ncbi:MAG: hypothetical protein ACMUHM_08235 [Thermoplasmatota archaeon]